MNDPVITILRSDPMDDDPMDESPGGYMFVPKNIGVKEV